MSEDLLTTSAAAEVMEVAASTLRYWEKEFGNYLNIKRDSRGYRQYCEEDLKKLKKIKELLYQQKLSIKQVRTILQYNEDEQELAVLLADLSSEENKNSPVEKLMGKLTEFEKRLSELQAGQSNLKKEYLQALNMLNINLERRDRRLVKEIRERLAEKKEKQSVGFLQRLLPW